MRLKLLDKLEHERHPEKRIAIHEQLAHASQLLGLSTPAIEAIGHAVRPEPISPLIAINMYQFERLALLAEFRHVLKQSESLRFMEIRTVRSLLNVRHNGRAKPADQRRGRGEVLGVRG